MGAAGKRPQSTHPLYQSKYHCYMTYFKIFSLGVWKTCLCSTRSCREARYLFCPFFFFRLLSIEGPANLCDSVATECLPAAECSALLQPSPPPPPSFSIARCLPADPTDWLSSSSYSPWASRPRAALSELAHLY